VREEEKKTKNQEQGEGGAWRKKCLRTLDHRSFLLYAYVRDAVMSPDKRLKDFSSALDHIIEM